MKHSMLPAESIQWIKQLDTEMAFKLLGRLVSDCEYYYGYGNKRNKHLWALHPWSQAEALETCRDRLYPILDNSTLHEVNNYINKLYKEEE